MPLAQSKPIYVLPGGLCAWGSAKQVVALATVAPLLVLSHEKRLLAHCTRYPPLYVGPSPRRGDSKKRPRLRRKRISSDLKRSLFSLRIYCIKESVGCR